MSKHRSAADAPRMASLVVGTSPNAQRRVVVAQARRALTLASLVGALPLVGCGASLLDLRRAEESYDQARYEAALEWLLDVDPVAPSFDTDDRARYFYVRGMTEYRLGHRDEALYYLALAHETAGPDGEGLRAEQEQVLERTYGELRPTEPLTHRAAAAAD